jgi:DNA-binding NarL/FixJ family response regulator
VRVVLAEDLYLLRDGLVRRLEAHDFEIVAAVASGPELRRALATHQPDVSIVDVRLPPTFTDEGLQEVFSVRARSASTPPTSSPSWICRPPTTTTVGS